MDLSAKYYIFRICVVNHIRTDSIVRGDLLYTDAIELLKTYMPNPHVGNETSRTMFFDSGWEEYCVVAEPQENNVDDDNEIPF